MTDTAGTDPRLDALRAWLRRRGWPDGPLASASSDASFRRYFRLPAGDGCIVMDAPPGHEDCRPFIRVAGLLEEAGLRPPPILDADPEQGFLVLGDLGPETALEQLQRGAATADGLLRPALDALVRWQAATRPAVLPPFDAALLERELRLFPDWYLRAHLGVIPTAAEGRALEAWFRRLIDRALAQPVVWVHRDYMLRNLMPGDPEPGILDFQDAVTGPVSYDLVSLLRDAFHSFPEATEWHWLCHYHGAARAAGVPVPPQPEALWSDCNWMGVQRHLKVLGIFARIRYRDGKPHYLADAPRFRTYLARAAAAEPELQSLVELIDDLHGRAGGG